MREKIEGWKRKMRDERGMREKIKGWKRKMRDDRGRG